VTEGEPEEAIAPAHQVDVAACPTRSIVCDQIQRLPEVLKTVTEHTKHLQRSRIQPDHPGLTAGAQLQAKVERVLKFLQTYWSRPHRSIGIDAGTTTEEASHFMMELRKADRKGGPNLLSLFTNSPGILNQYRNFAEELAAHPERTPSGVLEVISIGGRLRVETDALTGELARRCLESWNLHLDIAIIGSTNINFQDGLLRCDSEDEALTKSTFLHRSTLRCIVADSSKFRWDFVMSSFPFVPIDSDHVDLIITDDSATEEHFRRFAENGVLMLTPGGRLGRVH
jgi:DeoR/GlpR family transcriptional regulator of sugar metabolism